jgi:thioredoxin-related protein
LKSIKFTRIIGAALIISFAWITTPAPVLSESEQIAWSGYQDGMERMETEDKKGLLHFYTTWCTYCKLMNKNTFTDAKVIRYVNENYIPVYINAEVDTAAAKTYGANKFPFTVFLDEGGGTIGNRPGYIQPDMLLDMLTYIHNDDYKTITFSAFLEKKKEGNAPEPSKSN